LSEDKPEAAYIETRPACPQHTTTSAEFCVVATPTFVLWLAARMIEKARAISLLMLLLEATPANAEQFTVRCANRGYYHVTFDTDSGRVVFESVAGLALKGRFERTAAGDTVFRLVKSGTRDFEVILATSRDSITWVGIPGDNTRQGTTDKCNQVGLRPILSKWDLIFPY
jgi:hypothetical protein